MILGLFVTLTGTVLSDQDGFGRMFSEGTRILLRGRGARGGWLRDERLVRRLYVLGLLMVVPIAVHLAVDEPITLLQLAGAIEAAQIPIVTVLVLCLNRRRLAPERRPSLGSVIANGLSAAFFAVFAALYAWQLFA
ncbi:hypothetical protein [Sorangium sp. So ce233]|uniref:hypothetical protein n=1 Tax=Sorangium sp. So ce233 TaxID=3133290 RepID=UPI003F5DA939